MYVKKGLKMSENKETIEIIKDEKINIEEPKKINKENNKNIFNKYLIIIVIIIISAPLIHLFTTKMLNNIIKDTPVIQLPNNGGDM